MSNIETVIKTCQNILEFLLNKNKLCKSINFMGFPNRTNFRTFDEVCRVDGTYEMLEKSKFRKFIQPFLEDYIDLFNCVLYEKRMKTGLQLMRVTISILTKTIAELETMRKPRECTVFKKEEKCVICLEKTTSILFIPCGHRCVCTKCNKKITGCPMCRAKVNFFINMKKKN
jgi:hypothetical protein